MSVLDLTPNHPIALEIADYPFIAIIPKITRTRSRSTC